MILSPAVAAAVGGGVLVTAAVLAPVPRATSRSDPPPAAVQYVAPLPTPLVVLRGFDPPDVQFGSGHLGVDLRASDGQRVTAAAAGTVQFAGQVAGRGVVVLAHPDGIRTEYEPIRASVSAGQHVASGTVLGTVHGRQAGCPAACLHWGARRGTDYLDPLALLRPLGPVVLLPDGEPTRGQARG